jgi:LysM repeat protein
MKHLREPLIGFLYLLLSALLVLGAFSLSISENMVLSMSSPAPTMQISPQKTVGISPSPTSKVVMVTATIPQPTACPVPEGWVAYIVQPQDSMEELAAVTYSTLEQLMSGNCLVSSELIPDTILYVPPLPTPTNTPTPVPGVTRSPTQGCGAPQGWNIYTVRAGDNLFRISQLYYTTVKDLQYANCLGSRTQIITGQKLYVPNVNTRTPLPNTKTPTPILATKTPTPTGTLVIPGSPTPTQTQTQTATVVVPGTATSTVTFTVTFTVTATETETSTPIP